MATTTIMNGRAIAQNVPVPDEVLPAQTECVAVYAVHNRVLRVLLAVSFAVIACLAAAVYKVSTAAANIKPLVIRVNESGQATASEYAAVEYQPREAEIRYFLTRFVVDHYSRMRATKLDAFQRSLYFMDAGRARAAMEQETRDGTIPKLLSGAEPEVDIRVKNVAIQEMTAPFKASVDFEKIYISAHDRREIRRETYVGQFTFTVMETVPNNIVTVNPLGLVVTYFREDQAFQ